MSADAVVPRSEKLRVAVVGCGDVSTIHFEAIAEIETAELVAVCDRDPSALEYAGRMTGKRRYADLQKMIDDVRPDVIHVATPHHEHVESTLTALAAGVHVIQEKPLAHTLAEAQRVVDAAEEVREKGTKIGICFQNRYNVSSQKAAELLADGAIGNITGAWASVVWARTEGYYKAKPWRGTWEESGGGLLINQAIHTLDLVQWLLGDVVEIDGRSSTRRYGQVIEVEDTAEALFTHENGVETTFYATLTSPTTHPVELEIVGEDGRITIRDGITLQKVDGTVETWAERKVPSTGRAYWGVSHEILIRDFYEKIPDPEPFWISPAEGMKSMRMLKAIYDQSYGPNHT
ncbi:MAG TPA: Gfo/Idh/MocA family oxidoreductase [Actinomycetaceae bacterium]|nr:Gfo/Idh/MocA family oxidoreductase [Actinomycetaceae bacterium]